MKYCNVNSNRHHLWKGILFVLCFLCHLPAKSDDYKPMLKDGRIWNYIEVYDSYFLEFIKDAPVEIKNDYRKNSVETYYYIGNVYAASSYVAHAVIYLVDDIKERIYQNKQLHKNKRYA